MGIILRGNTGCFVLLGLDPIRRTTGPFSAFAFMRGQRRNSVSVRTLALQSVALSGGEDAAADAATGV
jgi:hypothetical protein